MHILLSDVEVVVLVGSPFSDPPLGDWMYLITPNNYISIMDYT